jgi:hypothetical protein
LLPVSLLSSSLLLLDANAAAMCFILPPASMAVSTLMSN